jgi:hypothetical protein
MLGRAYGLVLALSIAAASACSSADLVVADPQDGGGTGTDTAGPGSDTAVDPCAVVDGVAKFCLTVDRVATHPSYDRSTGAEGLGIDGKGIFKIYLFKEDPGPAIATGKVIDPIGILDYPGGDAEVSIDSMPITIAGASLPQRSWFIVVFQDSKAARTASGTGTLAGDFVLLPKVGEDKVTHYPDVTLVNGTTQTVHVELKPLRTVSAAMSPSAELVTRQKANPTIHGDGPLAFLMFDGDLASATPSILDVSFIDCVDFFKATTFPLNVSFTTTTEGSHNLLAVLFDYDYPPPKDFPGKGNIFSPTADAGPTAPRLAKVNVSAGTWTASTEVTLAFVDAYTTERPIDPHVCR